MFPKKKYYHLLFFPLFFMSYNKLYGYENEQGTPAAILFNYIGKHSYIGFSTGVSHSNFLHIFKKDIATVVVFNKKLFVCQYENIDKQHPNTLPDFYLHKFQWPSDSYFRIDPNTELKAKAEEELREFLNNKNKKTDHSISGRIIGIPIRFTYLYEFESKKFRLSFDPCLTIIRTSKLKLKTIADATSGAKAKNKGDFDPENKWWLYLEIPFGLQYRMIHTKLIDIFLCATAGLQFSSYKLGTPQPYYNPFWNLGLIFEYPQLINYKPFVKIFFSKGSLPDTRIKKQIKDQLAAGVGLSHSTIGIEIGARFKIIPDKSRCGIPKCNIKYDHVHGRTNLRGRSYFNS